MSSNILLIEDHKDTREIIQKYLSQKEYQVTAVTDKNSAIDKINSNQKFDAVIVDLKLPTLLGYGDEDTEHGFDVLQTVRKKFPNAWIAVITGYGDAQNARRAWALGAEGFLEKPLDYNDLLKRLDIEISIRRPQEDSGEFYEWPAPPPLELINETGIIGNTPVMRELCKNIGVVARNPAIKNILLQGETGTGKELFAEAIYKLSPRSGKPYLKFSCAAITETMAEVDLFGVLPGVGPDIDKRDGLFKQANSGTLLLDDVDALSLKIQPKLLRALENGEILLVGGRIDHVDVRAISTTNQDLEEAIVKGEFRPDLYQRLGSNLYIPPLREHKKDIPHLVNYFIRKYVKEQGDDPDNPRTFPLKAISKNVWNLLYDYDWPGNIRELKKVVQNALTFQGSVLSLGDILRALIKDKKDKPELLQNPISSSGKSSRWPYEPEQALFESFKRLVELGNEWNVIEHYLVSAAMAEKESDTDAANLIGMKNPNTLRSKKDPKKGAPLKRDVIAENP